VLVDVQFRRVRTIRGEANRGRQAALSTGKLAAPTRSMLDAHAELLAAILAFRAARPTTEVAW
jgi:hypothetical protein